MKVATCLLLAVVAAVSADDGFYTQPQSFQPAPDTYSNYNNYYDYQQPQRKQGWMDRIFGANRRQWLDSLFGSNRRQGLAGLLGGLGGLGVIGPMGLVVVAAVALAAVTGLAYVVSELDNSGRGLDSDEWEVDHSVWMDQLHKDFEDSWSTE